MAKRQLDGASQSGFIREHLNADKDVKHRVVADGWIAAGHPGEIKSSLFYLVKSKMLKASKKKRGRPPNAVTTAASPAEVEADDSLAAYHEIERALDSLIDKASDLRDAKLAHELRAARRRVSIKII